MKLTSRLRPKSKRMKLKNFRNSWQRLKKCAVAEANRERSEYWKNCLEKIVEELRASKERCFEKSLGCMEKMKASFAKVGLTLTKITSYEATLRVLLNG
jgi:hypothetical protein